MFNYFQTKTIETSGAKINLVIGGQGEPLLLLHGYPQTHLMWHKIAHLLAEDFTVIATDLRGYGASSKPPGEPDHSNYAKRVMAQDQVEVMFQLGYETFALVGHDRGARVAHRLTLDYPTKVKKLALLDILPTYELYANSDREFATAYYHWFFLIQPYPFPETLISNNAEYFLRHCLSQWSKVDDAFTQATIAEYLLYFDDWATIHSTCEDYRAAASIDSIHDQLNREQKITCPLLVLWGKQGIIGKKYDILASWTAKAINVQGKGLNCGHFLPEEAPNETYSALRNFLVV
ncbi:Haloacetate dehalogenase [Stanieria cyanosphaera PCC 7437]|uniref:Haloacetate dehalogenase n=1 Tax=Stanieria cyanosphaera (strain ATCC 29371 / PCC 7437) TaxID=111780 RepID=K9XSQ9_STAC7|nr:alpha/beta hydrolase [Stanieria cyanosphaera]AFZ35106.1 Haloacetate dehalogenase [Stanieria cyanosphaera PCC 7437]